MSADIDVRRLPGRTNAERLAEYVKLSPRCGVRELSIAFGVGGDIWAIIIDAMNAGLITGTHPTGEVWFFEVVA